MSSTQNIPASATAIALRFLAVRRETELLCATLSAEDQMVQSCAEASPTKWHQAHTTWFFETFVLREFAVDYQPFDPNFHWLFNSYYIGLGNQIPAKKLRASFSRPSLEEIQNFRRHVDTGMEQLLTHDAPEEAVRRTVIGLHHEQQHQELLLTDIKHAFFTNPLHPVYRASSQSAILNSHTPDNKNSLHFTAFSGALAQIGYDLRTNDPGDFAFDNETPRHRVYVEAFSLANRLTTCGEYLDFITDNGYTRPELWLSEGWDTVQSEAWEAPLYWQRDAADPTGWRVFTLSGWQGLSAMLQTPVCHISFFEADAFARWSGKRLPTEAQWEIAATAESLPLAEADLAHGSLHPQSATAEATTLQQFTGRCWQWTASAYTGYPGYQPLPGALGEYNGKFMSNQMVLRGGSCVTPAQHLRNTYRNFFSPATRWQFSGIRLAQ